MDSLPIVEVRVRNMEHTMLAALTEKEAERDQWIADALHQALSEGAVKVVIAKEVSRTLERIIAQEVERYFQYGKGREIVKRRVLEDLER